MRTQSAYLILLSALRAACGGTHSVGGRAADPESVIHAVMSSPEGKAIGLDGLFPKQPTSASCVIRGGGPGFTVAGTCASRVDPASDGSAVASFIETGTDGTFTDPAPQRRPASATRGSSTSTARST